MKIIIQKHKDGLPINSEGFSVYVDFSNLSCDIFSINYYLGNPTLFPDIEVIKEIKKEIYQETKNKTFSFDVGINEKYETFFLELNNCLAIGNYGISENDYTNLILETWKQYKLLD